MGPVRLAKTGVSTVHIETMAAKRPMATTRKTFDSVCIEISPETELFCSLGVRVNSRRKLTDAALSVKVGAVDTDFRCDELTPTEENPSK
jgi:hypothetical protein